MVLSWFCHLYLLLVGLNLVRIGFYSCSSQGLNSWEGNAASEGGKGRGCSWGTTAHLPTADICVCSCQKLFVQQVWLKHWSWGWSEGGHLCCPHTTVGARGTLGQLQLAYNEISFFYVFVKYSEEKINQVIGKQKVMSAFTSSGFGLERLGVLFTW